MMMRNLITAIALAGFATGAAALDSTEQRLVDYGFMPEPIQPSQVVNTVEVSQGSIGMDQAVALGFAPAATEVKYTGRFHKQPKPELTATDQRLQDLGFQGESLTYRAMPSDHESQQMAERTAR